MSAEQSPEAATELDLVERASERVRMPAASPALRLKTSTWVRRLLPTALVVDRAVHKGQRLWEQSDWWRGETRAAMATVLGQVEEAELERIAREHLIEREAQDALFWQPWAALKIDERSELRLREALRGEHGVLVSQCHVGPYFQVSTMLAPFRRLLFGVVAAWFFGQPTSDESGRRLARWRQAMQRDARIVAAKGSYAVVRALLAQGEWVVLFFDLPGHRETRFLGKPAMLADGTARLAIESEALVLPVRTRRAGHRVHLDVAEALDPRAFADAEELHAALARVHERWILECPAAMADPRGFGWGQGASAQAWLIPDDDAG
jgi:lauroyl/myristoyl acyltransferase